MVLELIWVLAGAIVIVIADAECKQQRVIHLCGFRSSRLKKLKGEGVSLEALQRKVDEKLAILANDLFEAFQSEEEIRKELDREPNEAGLLALNRVRRNVRLRKKSFWRYHGLAKELGFKVKEKYSEYLPNPALKSI